MKNAREGHCQVADFSSSVSKAASPRASPSAILAKRASPRVPEESARTLRKRRSYNHLMIRNVLASVAVRDLNSAMKWYESLLGRPADSRPMSEVAEWKFEGGGWLQVYQLPERAGSGSFTLSVNNLQDEVRKVRALGIDTSRQTSSDKVNTLMIADPDGNHIAFAEASDRNMAG
jgi:predicted enzyme related to lactoylglutathione lyase